MTTGIEVRITEIGWETDAVRRFELRSVSGDELPEFTAGAHIDLHLPIGLTRSYSLLNSQNERHRYVIAVSREPDGRGGSRYLHEQAKPGERLHISKPRNLFPLAEHAATTILLGGGIGVTPLLSMARRLQDLERSWKLVYCSRSRSVAAFADALAAFGPEHVDFWFDDERPGFLDIAALLRADRSAHFYCCGPKPMMAAFEQAASETALPSSQSHVEYFQPKEDVAPQGGFSVELARTGLRIAIPPGKSILEALKDAGISTTSSCEAGICGECQVGVLAGTPDHHDSVLSDAEQASNKMMMICCSGSKSELLVLDL